MTTTEISAGGIIYRESAEHGFDVCLITARGKRRWQLPKGWVEPGETREQAAQREVHEETGLFGEVEEALASIDFWYVWRYGGKPERRHKFVHHFLLRYMHGQTEDHDSEVDDARWVPLDNALLLLAFPNERAVAQRAADILRSRQVDTGR